MALKLAMVGCGGMGLRHAFAYIELRSHFDTFDLVAVCDRHEESAYHVASEVESATGRRPKVYTDFDQMLTAENIVVDITTDTRMHHSFAIGAMESGTSESGTASSISSWLSGVSRPSMLTVGGRPLRVGGSKIVPLSPWTELMPVE